MLGDENVALLEEFMGKIKDKSLNEIMPILMEFKNRLPNDRQFTQQEKEQIIAAAIGSIPDEEKNSYKAMLKVLKFM